MLWPDQDREPRVPSIRSLLLTAALSAVPALAPAQATRDSAGVRIVENARPALAEARAWRVEPSALLTIGGPGSAEAAAGDSLYEFALVMGAARLRDGRYAVAVQGSHAVRFYDARGRLVGSAGRRGQGPGEFQQILGLGLLAGDTLAVIDLGEVELFAPDGKFARTGASRARGGDFGFIWPQAFFADGSYAGFDLNDRSIPAAGRSVRRQRLMRVMDDGRRTDTLGAVPTLEGVFDGRQPWGSPVVHAPMPLLAAREGAILYAFPQRYEILEYDLAGRVVRSIRRQWAPAKVDARLRETYLAHVRAMPGEDGRPMNAEMRAFVERRLATTVYADELPALGDLLVDRAGNLWAEHYDPARILYTPGPSRTRVVPGPTRWDVFDRGGRWLTTVQLPARFTPFDVGEDYVLGLAHDDDEVEFLRVHRLRKP